MVTVIAYLLEEAKGQSYVLKQSTSFCVFLRHVNIKPERMSGEFYTNVTFLCCSMPTYWFIKVGFLRILSICEFFNIFVSLFVSEHPRIRHFGACFDN